MLCSLLLSCQEIDDLVDEWSPEPLAQPLSPEEEADLAAVPVIVGPTGPKPRLANGKTVINLASYNFTGLAGNEDIKASAVETLKKYGLGSCGPPGFYGTQGERDRLPPANHIVFPSSAGIWHLVEFSYDMELD